MLSLVDILNQRTVDFSKLNTQELVHAAKYHRLVGAVYTELNTLKNVPSELLDHFKLLQQQNVKQTLLQMRMLIKLDRLFNAHNISYLVLKGLLLSQRLYADPARRQSMDLDVLIDPTQLLKVDQLLQEDGYIPLSHATLKETEVYLKKFSLCHHDLTYLHPDSPYRIEVHFRLHDYNFNTPYSTLYENCCSSELMGHTFSVLSPVDEWIYLCTHGSRHGFARLQWVKDIVEYQRSQLSFNSPEFYLAVNEKARRNGLNKHCELAVNIAQHYFPSYLNKKKEKFPMKKTCEKVIMGYYHADAHGQSNRLPRVCLEVLQWRLTVRLVDKWRLLIYLPRSQFWLSWTKKKIPVHFYFLCYLLFLGKLLLFPFKRDNR